MLVLKKDWVYLLALYFGFDFGQKLLLSNFSLNLARPTYNYALMLLQYYARGIIGQDSGILCRVYT